MSMMKCTSKKWICFKCDRNDQKQSEPAGDVTQTKMKQQSWMPATYNEDAAAPKTRGRERVRKHFQRVGRKQNTHHLLTPAQQLTLLPSKDHRHSGQQPPATETRYRARQMQR